MVLFKALHVQDKAKLGKKSFQELPETVQITQIFLTQMVRSICPEKLPIYTIGEASWFCDWNSGQNSNRIIKIFTAVCIFDKIPTGKVEKENRYNAAKLNKLLQSEFCHSVQTTMRFQLMFFLYDLDLPF